MYNRPRIIPVLSIQDEDLVKTVRFKDPTYLGDPVNAVKIFNRKGVDELSILDIGATKSGRAPDFTLLRDIASEAFMPLSYGGGIRTMDEIRELIRIGYEKVIINTSFIDTPELIRSAAVTLGSQSVVVSIDAMIEKGSGYTCVVSDGDRRVDKQPCEMARAAEELGAGESLLNSVDCDGMMGGYDIELVRSVVSEVSIPVIACGGAGGVADLKRVIEQGGAHAAAGGSMFVFYGRLKAVLITAPSESELIEAGLYSAF